MHTSVMDLYSKLVFSLVSSIEMSLGSGDTIFLLLQ